MTKLTPILLALLAGGALSVGAADAKDNWSEHCAMCHAENGAGKTRMGVKAGVKDLTDAKVQVELKDEEMFELIKEGKKHGDPAKMKAFAGVLSDKQIRRLVVHVRRFKK